LTVRHRRPAGAFLTTSFQSIRWRSSAAFTASAAEAAGNAAAYAASHTPLDFLAPGSTTNPNVQSSADRFGRDVTAMFDSPAHGRVTPSAAAVPIAAAGAKILPEAETVAKASGWVGNADLTGSKPTRQKLGCRCIRTGSRTPPTAPAKTREKSRRGSGRASGRCSASGLCGGWGYPADDAGWSAGAASAGRGIARIRRLVAAATGPKVRQRAVVVDASLGARRRSCASSRSGGRAGKSRADLQ
jgi:hypothetical protein